MTPIYTPKGAAAEYAVYMHTFPNGKRYIGISRNISRRFRNGKGYEGQPIIWSAIQKYGWESVNQALTAFAGYQKTTTTV